MSRMLIVFTVLGLAVPASAADVFDRHTSKWLRKGIENQKPLKNLSVKDAGKLKMLSSDVSAQCIVVTTNEGNIAKALVGWGYRRGKDGGLIPVLLIERFVTYRGNGGDSTVANGKSVMLFAGFAFNFDIGQVVPPGQGEDVRFTGQRLLEPVGRAELFGLDGSQLPEANGDAPDLHDHDGVLPRDFSGTWTMTVDGRWKGELRLSVGKNGRATGSYTSKDSKSTYKVTGRIAALKHNIKLNVAFDNTTQTIDAFLFTKDKSTLSGAATLAGRKFGFYAKRKPARK